MFFKQTYCFIFKLVSARKCSANCRAFSTPISSDIMGCLELKFVNFLQSGKMLCRYKWFSARANSKAGPDRTALCGEQRRRARLRFHLWTWTGGWLQGEAAEKCVGESAPHGDPRPFGQGRNATFEAFLAVPLNLGHLCG